LKCGSLRLCFACMFDWHGGLFLSGGCVNFIFGDLYLMFVKLKTSNVKLRSVTVELSEDLREEMKKLKEEIAGLKEQLGEYTEAKRRRRRGIYIDVGNRVQDYIDDVMEGVAEGIHGELERSVFIGPRGVRIVRGEDRSRGEYEAEVNFPKAAELLSALGQEHRLRVLKELMSGGKYINELQESLSEITTSTLSSHLKVLEDAGLVVQEKVRGRYLITMPGRAAYKMARRITRFVEERSRE
jgi:DNA-binding HxlR family transcriptional regulator